MNRVVNNQSDLQIEFLSERARCTVGSVELCRFRQLARSRINLPIGLVVDNSDDGLMQAEQVCACQVAVRTWLPRQSTLR